MNRKQRGLALVTASLPLACAVCGNARTVQLVRYTDVPQVGAVKVNCPHCSNHGHPIPIIVLPMRVDQLKGDVA